LAGGDYFSERGTRAGIGPEQKKKPSNIVDKRGDMLVS